MGEQMECSTCQLTPCCCEMLAHYAADWEKCEDEAQPAFVEVHAIPDPPGTIWTRYVCADGVCISTSQRSSFELSADATLTYKALEFKYAARRLDRVLIVAMFPKWAARMLAWFGIKGER